MAMGRESKKFKLTKESSEGDREKGLKMKFVYKITTHMDSETKV